MARRRVVGLIRPQRSRASVRELLQPTAAGQLSPGIRGRREHAELPPSDWIRRAAQDLRGGTTAPRWRV